MDLTLSDDDSHGEENVSEEEDTVSDEEDNE
jgi:hypothetical protein